METLWEREVEKKGGERKRTSPKAEEEAEPSSSVLVRAARTRRGILCGLVSRTWGWVQGEALNSLKGVLWFERGSAGLPQEAAGLLQEAGLWRYAATLAANMLTGDERAASLERWASHLHQAVSPISFD